MFNFNENKNLEDKKLKILSERCLANHYCPAVKRCPVDALTQNGFDAPKLMEEKCIKCGKCKNTCPFSVFNFV